MAIPTSDAPSGFTSQTTPAFIEAPVGAGSHIYGQQPVAIDSSGWAQPCDNVSGYRFVGFSQRGADNTGGANGAINVNYSPSQLPEAQYYDLACVGATQAWVGQVVYWADGLSVARSASQSVICGVVTSFLNSTLVTVNIGQRA